MSDPTPPRTGMTHAGHGTNHLGRGELADQLRHALGSVEGNERLRVVDQFDPGVGHDRGEPLGVGELEEAILGAQAKRTGRS